MLSGRDRILVGVVLAFVCSTTSAFGQSAAPKPASVLQTGASAPDTPAEAQPVDAPPAKPAGAEKKEPTASEKKEPKPKSRLERLKELKFDRRPSSVLQAWGEANGVKPPADKEKPKDEPKSEPDEAEPKKAETKAADPLDQELKTLQSQVTLGRWQDVKKYADGLTDAEKEALWQQLLKSLTAPTPHQGMPGTPTEPNAWTIEDLLGLAALRPKELNKENINSLGQILAALASRDLAVEAAVRRFETALGDPKEKDILSRRQVAQLLQAAHQSVETARFLPTIDEALAAKDGEALNLLSHHYLARRHREGKVEDLEEAWRANQAVIALDNAPDKDRQEALQRSIDLAQQVRRDLGQAWLDDSFAKQSERGAHILVTLGQLVGRGFEQHPRSPGERLQPLVLQKTAVAALLKANPERAREWRSTLQLLCQHWLREAEYSRDHDHSSGSGMQLENDPFGNFYYHRMGGNMMMDNQNQPLPITSSELLEQSPDDAWSALLDEGVRVRLSVLRAELLLKTNREEKAFPLIEELAPMYPQRAQRLAEEFLRVWKQNHDPNRQERYMNPFYFYYGFNDRAQSIPLTRSKQERNLVELAGWMERLKKLPIAKLDDHLLTDAFTTCHSNAEVYRLEAIERVFGPVEKLKPRTTSELAQQMRSNLAGLWRAPKVQEAAKTRRKAKDIEAEVLRGYDVARQVVRNAQTQYPDDWSLTLATAALELDESNYRHEFAKDSTFQERRQRAMAGFARAAELYAAGTAKLAEEDETIQVFEQWFHAGLGACDLSDIDDDKQPDPKQTPLVRAALEQLPGRLGVRHRERFASQLFTHLRSVKPAIKFRYLREGFTIVGEHPLAHEARKVFDYYQDLVSEIKLEATLDGSSQGNGVVGHEQPFGLLVSLRHTPEIERESGGFGRFLQNQSSMMFGYNYGRPAVDYRDRFTSSVQEALKENFEVLSITFQTDKVRSRETNEPGWRVTPYAYVLAKARGPQVDKMPPLKIDLDFLDTSGYVVLPVESPAVPLDAKPKLGSPRQPDQLAITQILDERQADTGKLLLEVKATARGLVSELDELLDLKFAGFKVNKIEDRGLAVTKFDDEFAGVAILSERSWQVSLDATDGPIAAETPFQFAAVRAAKSEKTWQRYQDADLQTVAETVMLQAKYREQKVPWLAIAIAAGLIGFLAIGSVALYRRSKRPKVEAQLELPEPLTPFTVIGLLDQLQSSTPLPETQRAELSQAIAQLEHRYFSDNAHGNGDLRGIAEHWLRVTEQHRNR